MNKLFSFLLSTVLLTFGLISCGNDKDDPVKDVETTPYSELTPEQQKEKLQVDAMAFLASFEGLENEQGYKTLESFNAFLSEHPVALRSVGLRSSDEIIYINDFYGKYVWNSSKKTWDQSANSGSLIFEFPATETSTSNTEKITIKGEASDFFATLEEVDAVYIPDEWGGYYDYTYTYTDVQLPKTLNAVITSNGKTVGSLDVSSDLAKENVPTIASVAYTLGSYSLNFNANRTASNNTVSANLKKGSTSLISVTSGMSGNVEEIINEEAQPGSGNFQMTLMDKLAFSGSIAKIGEFMQKMNELEEQYDDYYSFGLNNTSEKYEKASCNLFNQYTAISLTAADGAAIATLSMKPVFDYSYTASYEPFNTYTYWTSIPVLNFKDGSSAEASVYFSKGFDQFFEQLEGFMNKFGWAMEENYEDEYVKN